MNSTRKKVTGTKHGLAPEVGAGAEEERGCQPLQGLGDAGRRSKPRPHCAGVRGFWCAQAPQDRAELLPGSPACAAETGGDLGHGR